MADPHVISALKAKRAVSVGEIELHQREIDRLRAEFVHIDAVLRIFDPAAIPSDIAARKRYPPRTEYFGRGELTRRILETIRDRGDTSPRELAEALMADRNIPESDRAIRYDLSNRFTAALHKLRRAGTVEKIGAVRGVRWRLTHRSPFCAIWCCCTSALTH